MSAIPPPPNFLVWSSHERTRSRVEQCGALGEVESALRRAYDRTKDREKGRLKPSAVVENELHNEGWKKTKPSAAPGLLPKDSFDGLKRFSEADLIVAIEIEWPWQRVTGDLLKFWRAQRYEQIDVGIEVLYGPEAFSYVVNHVYAMYMELLRDLRVVFCALDATDLRGLKFPLTSGINMRVPGLTYVSAEQNHASGLEPPQE